VSEFPIRPSEVLFVVAGVALVIWNFVRFAQVPDFWSWVTPLCIVVGLAVADFVSGLVHWAGDTWGTEKSPLLGWRFIRPFRFHHAHPQDMLKSNFFTTNGDTVLGAAPMLIAPLFFPLTSAWWLWAAVLVCSVGAFGMWSSQCHLWAHMKRPPRLVRWMQACRLILRPKHHLRHHRSPHQVNYCITTGWCNPLLDRIRYWAAMEWIVSRLTGLKPRPDQAPVPVMEPATIPPPCSALASGSRLVGKARGWGGRGKSEFEMSSTAQRRLTTPASDP